MIMPKREKELQYFESGSSHQTSTQADDKSDKLDSPRHTRKLLHPVRVCLLHFDNARLLETDERTSDVLDKVTVRLGAEYDFKTGSSPYLKTPGGIAKFDIGTKRDLSLRDAIMREAIEEGYEKQNLPVLDYITPALVIPEYGKEDADDRLIFVFYNCPLGSREKPGRYVGDNQNRVFLRDDFEISQLERYLDEGTKGIFPNDVAKLRLETLEAIQEWCGWTVTQRLQLDPSVLEDYEFRKDGQGGNILQIPNYIRRDILHKIDLGWLDPDSALRDCRIFFSLPFNPQRRGNRVRLFLETDFCVYHEDFSLDRYNTTTERLNPFKPHVHTVRRIVGNYLSNHFDHIMKRRFFKQFIQP